MSIITVVLCMYSLIVEFNFIGILMVLAWPILAYLGITMARHMKPALPNGEWFQIHRILVLTSLFFTCVAFILIFVAYRNNDTRGLITLGDIVSLCVQCIHMNLYFYCRMKWGLLIL